VGEAEQRSGVDLEGGDQVRTSEEGFAPVNGCRLYYEIRGEGPAVTLIHAGLWDRRIWDDQMEPFAERHTAIRLDLPGFGRSEFPDRPFSTRGVIADLLGFLQLERTSVVGCSIGGQVALDLTLDRPDLVERLVLVASGMSGDDTPDDEATILVLDQAEEAFKVGDLERAVDLQLEVWTPLRTDPEVDRRIRDIAMDNQRVDTLDWSLAQRLDPPAAGRLGEVRAPTLVILGERDVPPMAVIGDKLAAGIAAATKVVMPDVDHLPNMRDPVAFNRIVLGFLDQA
jgi:pimeloyl-ACP methyl ester carboxylesterase